jgi:hypothetical protein
MKKVTISLLTLLTVVLYSCGASEEDQKKVCECEKLNEKMRVDRISNEVREDMSPEIVKEREAAAAKAEAENKSGFEECEKLKKDLGESPYFQLTQKCSK